MNKKNFTGIVGFLMSVLFLLSVPLQTAAADTIDTVNDIKDIADGILSCKTEQNGAADIQAWIDGTLTETAGTLSEWYILSLRQYGDYDFSAYTKALDRYMKETEIRSAVERLKFALVGHAIGYGTEADISAVLDESVGQMGIMSWIYGLHLMNNGYTAGSCSVDDVISALLSMQHEDGGWSVSGAISDVDVTAMTLQALAPNVGRSDRVGTAIDAALQLLSARQKEDGCYASYGVNNPESAAQVWIALSALGIDCTQDERFIKNGCTVIDGILNFRLQDGSFSHTEGGASNETATVQVLTASVTALRMAEGKTPFYLMERLSTDPSDNPAAASTPDGSEANTLSVDSDSGSESLPTESSIGIKPMICLIVFAAGCMVCLVFFLCGKRNPKNFIAVGLLTAAAVCVIYVTDVQSAEDYYSGADSEKDNIVGTVTLTIRCDTVAEKTDSDYIPEDGVILDVTPFSIIEGNTVFDILNEAAQNYHIQIENNGQLDMIYIAGIQYLYEFDFGDLSGWIYKVNGETPSVGCGDYVLSDGDEIAWLYTCDLGNDLN